MVRVDRKRLAIGSIGVKYPLIRSRMLLSVLMVVALMYVLGTLWILVPMLVLYYGLSSAFGVIGELVGLVVMVGGIAAVPYLYYRKAFQRLDDAEKLTRDDSPDWFDEFDFIERECEERGIEEVDVYLQRRPDANAFALGRPGNGHVVLTDSLAAALDDPAELRAIIAHELAHIQHRDSVVMSVLIGFKDLALNLFKAMGIAVGSALSGSAAYAKRRIRRRSKLMFAPIDLFLLSISRHREYVADAEGAEATDPVAMKNALDSISSYNPETFDKDVTTSLCVIGETVSGMFERLRRDHPPVESRKRRIDMLTDLT